MAAGVSLGVGVGDEEAAALIAIFGRVKMRPGDDSRFIIEEGFFAVPRQDEYDELEDEDDFDEEDEDEEEDDENEW